MATPRSHVIASGVLVAVFFLASLFIFDIGLLNSAEVLSLKSLIQEARDKNPDILAAKKRYEAASARVPQAKSLDDPTMGVGFQYTPGSPFQLSKTPSQERMLSFSQFLPFFGKLSLKGKIALIESQMYAIEFKDQELKVINQLKNTYYDLFMNYKERQLNQEGLALLDSIVKIAEAKYVVGDMPQEELYKIYLEIARLNNTIKNLEQERAAKETSINALLNKDPEGPLGAPELVEDFSFYKDIRSLYQDALLNQPELIIFSYAIEKNKFAKDLARKSFFPDLMAQITERGFSTGTIGPWDLMLAFTVPLWFWTKQRYAVKEAIANLEEAQAAYQAMKNKAFAEVKDLAAKIEIAKNKIKLYRGNQIPLLESSIASSLSAYTSGKGDLMMLLDSERMLIETRMNYYKALVEYNMSLADLERTIGTDLRER